MTWRSALLVLLLGLGLLPGPARADLRLCNRTSYFLDAATANADNKDFISHGWVRVAPGACETTLKGDLKPIGYYIYARTSLAHSGPSRAWGGAVPICVQDGDFTMRSPPQNAACITEMGFRLPFAPVNTHNAKTWTVTLSESTTLKTMIDAQLAGVKRLLQDNGYVVGPIDQKPSKQTQAALNAFRARMRFPTGATNTDLFNALETEALKIAAPNGYTVCNETTGVLQVATGEKTPKEFISRGWWKIAAKSCTHLTSAALATDKIYVFARKDGKPLVSGTTKLCISEAEFEIHGNTACSSHNYVETGFAETFTKGKVGYIAHISDEGLLPPFIGQTTMSK